MGSWACQAGHGCACCAYTQRLSEDGALHRFVDSSLDSIGSYAWILRMDPCEDRSMRFDASGLKPTLNNARFLWQQLVVPHLTELRSQFAHQSVSRQQLRQQGVQLAALGLPQNSVLFQVFKSCLRLDHCWAPNLWIAAATHMGAPPRLFPLDAKEVIR